MGRLWRVGVSLGTLVLLGVGIGILVDRNAPPRGPIVAPRPLALPDLDTTVAVARLAEGTLVLREVTETDVAGVLVPEHPSPIDAHDALGLVGLQDLRDSGPVIRRSLETLLAPVETAPPHLGAGNNFADHQEETQVTDEPGLFPKMARPSAWNTDIPHAGHLDHEVELCAVALAPIPRGETGPIGFLLCNDFTDRWSMVTGLRPGSPLGTTGFADGKGLPGFLPTGPWLVVAEDPAAFAASVDLRLSVNGHLCQEASQAQAIWDHPTIVARAFERCGWDFRYRGEPVDWPACDELRRGTLVLGGTPGGVVFRLTNVWAGWKYLQPGDVVVTEAKGLGRLVNHVR